MNILFRLLLTGVLFAPSIVLSQITPSNTSIRPAAIAVPVPSAYPAATVNYIRTWEPSMATSDPSVVADANRPVEDVKLKTQYFDGLGRPLQTVSKRFSFGKKDIVSPVIYNQFGQVQYDYLPYASSAIDGKFKNDAIAEQEGFMLNQYAGETIYYSQVEYESSPLNRVLKRYGQGNSWSLAGGSKPSENQYLVSTLLDGVIIWSSASSSATLPTYVGAYPAAQLYKNLTKDEQGNREVEFVDKYNRVILKRVESNTGAPDGHTGWLNTYYVYDELSNLRFVIPPKAVEFAIANNGTISQSIMDELCFRYQYDGRNRVIEKKIPGAAVVEMVYDARDLVIFTRDGNMRKIEQPEGPRWLTTFYDDLNRPVITALYLSADSREQLQTNAINASLTGNVTGTQLENGVHDLVVPTRVAGVTQYLARNGIVFSDGFESQEGDEFIAEIQPGLGSTTTTVSISHLPQNLDQSKLRPLIYNYYDDYTWVGAKAYDPGQAGKPQNGSSLHGEDVVKGSNTRGRITGIKKRVLIPGGGEQWLSTTRYYSPKGRMIQSLSDNIAGGVDVKTIKYDFNGKMLSTFLFHKNPRSSRTPSLRVLTIYNYDHAGRVLNITKQLNEDSNNKVIVQNTYNEVGQLQNKTLGNDLESLDYTYNIRGWVKGINPDYAKNGGSHYFGTELYYDHGYTQKQYSGNIAGITWRSKGDNEYRSYGFDYDPGSRLLKADFTQNNGSWNTSAGVNFSVYGRNGGPITYDANGNITSMTQEGLKAGGSQVIDRMEYKYNNNEYSNGLLAIADNAGDNQLGDFPNKNTTDDDYTYDVNGNLTKDKNKNIESISYNHLNLPQQIVITDKGTISYWYDAGGSKVQKKVQENGKEEQLTQYIGGFFYQNDVLQYMTHEEGRVRVVLKNDANGNPLPAQYVYDYFLKDHLDNTRIVLTEEEEQAVYAATMEPQNQAKEDRLFSNIYTPQNTVSDKPTGFDTDNNNHSVSKLKGDDPNKRIGPSLTLKVMAGDVVRINTYSWFNTAAQQPGSPPDLLNTILNVLSPGVANSSGGKISGGTPTSNVLSPGLLQFLTNKDGQNNSSLPKAFLNYVFFDEQLKYEPGASGVRQVQVGTSKQPLIVDPFTIPKNGYLYVYLSNESPQEVFFDDLIVAHSKGPMLEETHYYPYGLTMSGISSKAAGKPSNRYKYNGIEFASGGFSDGSGLEMYEANLRNLDPQTGRWWQVDPRPNYAISPYASMNLNPIRNSDNLGDSVVPIGQLAKNWGAFNVKTDKVQLNEISVTPNGGVNLSQFAWMAMPTATWSPPTRAQAMALPAIAIAAEGFSVPPPHPLLLTLFALAIPANLGNPSSDHPPYRPPLVLPEVKIPEAGELPWTPGISPGSDWTWHGPGEPETGVGNWVNDKTGQKLHPDLNHPLPRGPHWGVKQPDGSRWDVYPDGRVERNKRD